MREALLEGQRVDERFQRRARRAQRARHVDRAVARGIGEIRRADAGADLAARVVDARRSRPTVSGRAVRRVSLASTSSLACSRASIDNLMTFGVCVRRDRLFRRVSGEHAGIRGARSGSGSWSAAAASAALMRPRSTARVQHARVRARPLPGAYPAGAPPATVAAPPAAPPRATVSRPGSLPK